MGIKCPKCDFENPEDLSFCGKCGTQLPSPEKVEVTETLETPKEELTRGTTLANRYEIIEELGKGGMGRIYRVEDMKLKQEIALKLIKPEIAKDKKTIERFRNELKFARNIRHKNVCGMFDLGEAEGAHFITMEYVRGEDLRSLIRRIGQLPIGKSISIAKQLCEGLSEAHRLGVVHRDLKSSNIMIDKEGNVRIMDFGIARSLEAKGITGEGIVIGTPEYMSPEQVEGKEVDQRSDIYSLGVILFEMVTGQLPFEGDTPLSIAMKHKGEIPKEPKELNPQIPDDLSKLILKCMNKDRTTRYQSAVELLVELERIEKGIPKAEREIQRRKLITSREITVTLGLKKLIIPAFVSIAVIIIVLILWSPWSRKQAVSIPSDKSSIAILYFKNNSGDSSLDNWREGLSDLITTDLSQSKYVQVLSGDRIFSILKKLNLLEAEKYSSEDLHKIAQLEAVNYILYGSYLTAGNSFMINVVMNQIETGKVIISFTEKGDGEESIPYIIDKITERIKANLNISSDLIEKDIDRQISQVTTSSLEALKLYSEGRSFEKKGDYMPAQKLYERALGIDPEFALAYLSLGKTFDSMDLDRKAREFYKKAFELGNRLSEKEKYITQGIFYRSMGEEGWEKAVEVLKDLLELYPDHSDGIQLIASIYFGMEEWDKVMKLYDSSRIYKIENVYFYGYAALSCMALGQPDRAQKVIEDYIQDFSDNNWIHNRLAWIFKIQGRYDRALEEAKKAIVLDPLHPRNSGTIGDILLLKGDFKEAENELMKLFEYPSDDAHLHGFNRLHLLYETIGRFKDSISQQKLGIEYANSIGDPEWYHGFRLSLASAYVKLGNFEEAFVEIKESMETFEGAMPIEYKRELLHLLGTLYLKKDSIEEAQKTAYELKNLIESGINKKAIKYFYHLKGNIEIKKGNNLVGIEYLKKAVSLLPHELSWNSYLEPHALFISSLAEGYSQVEEWDRAIDEYEKIISLTTGRYFFGDIYAKAFYRLGKIYEQQGNNSKAFENYEKFLSLWKDADPGIAEVGDAKKRLERLSDR